MSEVTQQELFETDSPLTRSLRAFRQALKVLLLAEKKLRDVDLEEENSPILRRAAPGYPYQWRGEIKTRLREGSVEDRTRDWTFLLLHSVLSLEDKDRRWVYLELRMTTRQSGIVTTLVIVTIGFMTMTIAKTVRLHRD